MLMRLVVDDDNALQARSSKAPCVRIGTIHQRSTVTFENNQPEGERHNRHRRFVDFFSHCKVSPGAAPGGRSTAHPPYGI
ncbi:hypothetical protein NPIL_37941 [Nephila pilipes]|uniref:Uncharacterized protein n=1 Tax=Nephila pilipes TaxID=299642 RepID=A0A8X6U8G9_NEPPI|nr:hypothetical protein NPIL_37941 [Nephila pilipes]